MKQVMGVKEEVPGTFSRGGEVQTGVFWAVLASVHVSFGAGLGQRRKRIWESCREKVLFCWLTGISVI